MQQELEHLPVTAGIGKPRAEIGLGDAVQPADTPLGSLNGIGQAASEEGVGKDRKHQEKSCGHQDTFGREFPEQWQQHSHGGIKHQDIPAPEEKDMQKADDKEDHHPAVKRTEFPFGVLQLDGEAHPEEDGEERVELSIHKKGE